LGEAPIGEVVEATPGLTPAEREAILGGNAQRFFGLG
jgi:hypothetical protein